MSRAISQNIAWISAFLLSFLVFAVVLGLIFMIGPHKSKISHGTAEKTEHGKEEGHTSPVGSHGETHNGHEAVNTHDPVHDKASPEKPAAAHGQEAEEEISAESFKKPEDAPPHDEHAKPHH